MAVSFRSNSYGLVQRQLNTTSAALSKTNERLSSGLRINRASDDSAGLAVSTSLALKSRVFTQGIRNINDGISALAVAEGSLNELSGITIRLQELAEQAANGSVALTQRRTSQKELDQLVSEFNRLVASTSFNNLGLLDGSITNLRIQGGFGSTGGVDFGINGQLSRKVGTGTFSSSSLTTGAAYSQIADVNGDGKNDVITSSGTNISIQLGNGDGTFQTAQLTAAGGTPVGIETGDFNGDGKIDVAFTRSGLNTIGVALGNGNGTLQAATSYSLGTSVGAYITKGDFNGDGITDLGVTTTSGIEHGVGVLTGTGSGSFSSAVVTTLGLTNGGEYLLAYDYNGDGKDDLITGESPGSDESYVTYGSGTGTYANQLLSGFTGNKLIAGDFNRDGISDLSNGTSIYLNQGNGTYTAGLTGFSLSGPLVTGDFNGDGYLDMVVTDFSNATTIFGRGDGTFVAGGTTASTRASYSTGDLNGDGVDDLLLSNTTSSGFYSNTTRTSGIQYFSLTSQSDARSALDKLGQILGRVDAELGSIGAHQSRLQSALSALQGQNAGYVEANSRVLDADIAIEAAEAIRLKILQDTATSLAGQANQDPKIALTLIEGAG